MKNRLWLGTLALVTVVSATAAGVTITAQRAAMIEKSARIGAEPASLQKTKKSTTPAVSISADPTSVAAGGSVTLTWSSTNAKTCTASGGWQGRKALAGRETISGVTDALTFTLSCSGKKGSVSQSASVSMAGPGQPPAVQQVAVSLNVLGVTASSVNGKVLASDPSGFPLTYTVSSPPAVGTVSVNSNTGEFTYAVSGHATVSSDNFTVSVSNGAYTANSTVRVNFGIDPLLPNQWHLKNTGHDAFASNYPVAGNDLNVAEAWASGYSGNGVKVGVVDSGLEASHEDLGANVDLANSLNFLTGGNDPSRSASDPGFDHGTSVAGIVAAAAFNGKGGRGVAFNARLRGYNTLAPGAFSVSSLAASLGGSASSADTDVFNASFQLTPVAPALPSFSGTFQSIASTILGLRGGLGAVLVNAAGNEFYDFVNMPGTGQCVYANRYKVSCGDPANDERRGGFTPIVVGALDADGTHASYSSTGSSLWISAPAGEYGLHSGYVVGDNYDPAIVTTSRTGCGNYSTSRNPLDSGGNHTAAEKCQYTASMNGTSAAAPNVSAVVALMLEANPRLSHRDIKFILARTARKTDPTFAGVSTLDLVAGANVVLEQGWITNAGGWAFSNRYGFGAVDASAAVAMAKTYSNYLPPLQSSIDYRFSAAPPAYIAKNSAVGNYITFSVNEPFNSVESVIVFLNMNSPAGLHCNQIELQSPSGTRSILLHAANGFLNFSVSNSRILSNAFYGEPVNGIWKMTFLDLCMPGTAQTSLSTVASQVLAIVGH